jgi:ribose-phosphate pyrophosphokinase
VDDLDVAGIAVPYFLKKHLTAPVIVAPDHDGVQRAKRFRDLLLQHGLKDVSLAIVVDQRRRADKQDVGVDDALFDANFELVGDVQGKDCIIRDDIIESGRRVEYAAEKLRRAGASRVFAFCTHAVLSKEAYNRIERSSVVEVVCTNTLPLKQQAAKIQPLSVAALLAETIRRVHVKQSVSELFSPGGGAKSA